MNYIKTAIPGVWIIEPRVFKDSRGYFMEAFKQEEFQSNVGEVNFVQDNESCSTKGVLRGLHYQLAPFSQAKLVRVVKGRVLDVAVDLRKGSPTFGHYISEELTESNNRQLFVPRGFAHGFQVLSDEAVFIYKVDNPYMPAYERSIRFDDPDVHVQWIQFDEVGSVLSEKDRNAPFLKDAEVNFIY
ncbi:MAG: dTDP-4-dehydrorhamnose 3,5-epimerase [Massilibacteroides sp.]|nr:dTDP-4-dehydrorhamnose 3,5-epimerase [Massilibacteroides sp.]MDD3063114.1 dTDP-4-dehydrorhamnose 3,5-epimerase [Massilibacteroides sp.]MDD4114596.1 dTDP-4-dehydrorhamnose 3,5-epimerase [Massilibacteroides sp.]MDD4660496.1 dTDP-4-dehydrorhamnose 3,5-epimerase [Massilibacteroides sp.]